MAEPSERLLSRNEAATILNISLTSLYRITRSGRIGRYLIGAGRVLYGQHHIDSYLRSTEQAAREAVRSKVTR
jgi:predicted site-specific integrase-resolvase